MNWGTPDQINRTAKILIDAGKASDPGQARRFLETLVLQVAVGPGIGHDPAAQAALATVVNAGHRAFLGGVHVQLDSDPALTTGWTANSTASQAVTRYGGKIVGELAPDKPTLALGQPAAPAGEPVLHLTWRGWAGGVVQCDENLLDSDGTEPVGIMAAGLGVSETFQQQLGAVVPGRRDVGLSLWRPDLDWRADEAAGPPLHYLPASLWLLGLGHLGQAYAWTLGMLPYATPNDVQLALMDFDVIVDGTWQSCRPSGLSDTREYRLKWPAGCRTICIGGASPSAHGCRSKPSRGLPRRRLISDHRPCNGFSRFHRRLRRERAVGSWLWSDRGRQLLQIRPSEPLVR